MYIYINSLGLYRTLLLLQLHRPAAARARHCQTTHRERHVRCVRKRSSYFTSNGEESSQTAVPSLSWQLDFSFLSSQKNLAGEKKGRRSFSHLYASRAKPQSGGTNIYEKKRRRPIRFPLFWLSRACLGNSSLLSESSLPSESERRVFSYLTDRERIRQQVKVAPCVLCVWKRLGLRKNATLF